MPNKDDLLNLNNKKTMKKPLIYGAVAFLIFIIAILGFAIYNNASSKQDNVVLPPQIKEEKQETMFKEVPIEESAPVNEKKENLAEKLIKKASYTQDKSPAETEQNKTVRQTKKETEEKSANVKPETKKRKTEPISKKQTAVSKGNYYIQVAALMKYKKPNKKFLNLLKKEGYSYRLYDTFYIKNGKKIGVVKILVGPYESKAKAKKALKRIKESITQNAFIYKVR